MSKRKSNFVSRTILTLPGTLSWGFLLQGEPKTRDDGKKVTLYRGDLIFEGDADMEPLRLLAYEAGAADWGPDMDQWPELRGPAVHETSSKKPNKQTGLPWKGYEHGKWYISAQSEYKPPVVDQDCNDIIDPAVLYSGCKCVFSVNAYTYDYKGVGIKFGLVAVMKVGEGEPLGAGRPDPSKIFKPLMGNRPAAGPPTGSTGRRML